VAWTSDPVDSTDRAMGASSHLHLASPAGVAYEVHAIDLGPSAVLRLDEPVRVADDIVVVPVRIALACTSFPPTGEVSATVRTGGRDRVVRVLTPNDALVAPVAAVSCDHDVDRPATATVAGGPGSETAGAGRSFAIPRERLSQHR
jgi:hypothetical protein